MNVRKFRYSLASLLICTTAVGLLGGLAILCQIGFRAHAVAEMWDGPHYGTLAVYGYRQDKLKFRDNKLDYILLLIFRKGTAPPTVSVQRNRPIFKENGRIIELPKKGQLYEYDGGRLTVFRERLTYSQWIDFVTRQSEAFRVKDLLKGNENGVM